MCLQCLQCALKVNINIHSELVDPEVEKFYANEKVNKPKLDVLFSALTRNRKLYHQIRLIDSIGKQ